MKQTFDEIKEKLKQFVESGEDSYFSSSINSLYSQLVNHFPEIPDVRYPFDELQSYSHQLEVAEHDEIQKYYLLCLQRLAVLESKAEQAGAV
ncbi:hypothetical protein [Pseudoalteromonas rhizosphaerae]|uniref:hypothetical protein n=1 Tax=Pseudoalteromonas rhizosphaerae TaxID=2518973 RepID=UPI0012305238|nr:hypothetical protein [Pseudoalteromonas rhizosphaerae]